MSCGFMESMPWSAIWSAPRWGHGTIAFGSRRGTSSHQYNPAVILAEKGTTETAGSCYGMLFVYSGNFSCEAEKDQFNQTRLLLGLNEELFSYPLTAGETFTVPEVILSYSADGLSALSQQYHNCIRNHVCRSKYVHMQRPGADQQLGGSLF